VQVQQRALRELEQPQQLLLRKQLNWQAVGQAAAAAGAAAEVPDAALVPERQLYQGSADAELTMPDQQSAPLYERPAIAAGQSQTDQASG
jgi:hypothetical protein